jgi:hypothetical protein
MMLPARGAGPMADIASKRVVVRPTNAVRIADTM